MALGMPPKPPIRPPPSAKRERETVVYRVPVARDATACNFCSGPKDTARLVEFRSHDENRSMCLTLCRDCIAEMVAAVVAS